MSLPNFLYGYMMNSHRVFSPIDGYIYEYICISIYYECTLRGDLFNMEEMFTFHHLRFNFPFVAVIVIQLWPWILQESYM